MRNWQQAAVVAVLPPPQAASESAIADAIAAAVTFLTNLIIVILPIHMILFFYRFWCFFLNDKHIINPRCAFFYKIF